MVSREVVERCCVNVIRGEYAGLKGVVRVARHKRLRVVLDEGFLVWLNRLSCVRTWEDELEELVELLRTHHNTHSIVAEADRRMRLLLPTT